MACAARKPVLWADHLHLPKPVHQALSPQCKMSGHLAQADPLNLCNRLRRCPLYIDGANNARLLRWKRRQEQVKAIAYQCFKLIVANGVWIADQFHKPVPKAVLQRSVSGLGVLLVETVLLKRYRPVRGTPRNLNSKSCSSGSRWLHSGPVIGASQKIVVDQKTHTVTFPNF